MTPADVNIPIRGGDSREIRGILYHRIPDPAFPNDPTKYLRGDPVNLTGHTLRAEVRKRPRKADDQTAPLAVLPVISGTPDDTGAFGFWLDSTVTAAVAGLTPPAVWDFQTSIPGPHGLIVTTYMGGFLLSQPDVTSNPVAP